MLGYKETIFKSPWPSYNPELAKEKIITLVIQINSKIPYPINDAIVMNGIAG